MATRFTWETTESFSHLDASKAFHAVYGLVNSMALPASCYQAEDEHLALLVTYGALCRVGSDRVTVQEAADCRHLFDASDGLLFISTPQALIGLGTLIATIIDDSAQVARPKWLATSLDYHEEVQTALAELNQQDLLVAGTLSLTDEEGRPCRFGLRLLDPITVNAQLRAAGPIRNIPEGPGNLQRREAWFQGRVGKKK